MADIKAKRAKITQLVTTFIEDMLPGSINTGLWRDRLEKMSDKEFTAFMTDLRAGKTNYSVIVPNMSNDKLLFESNKKVADKYGIKLFERLRIKHPIGFYYLTNDEFLILKLVARRQAQLLIKKTSIPEDNKSVDDLTGQPTGKSKGSKISNPEINILNARDLPYTTLELISNRGGDTQAFNAMNAIISRTGGVSQKAIRPYSGGVRSTQTLRIILTSMHLESTL